MKKSLKKVVKIGIAIIILIVLGIIGYFTWNFIEVNMTKQEEMEKDETPPTLEIKDLTLTQGKSYNVYSFFRRRARFSAELSCSQPPMLVYIYL